MVEERDDSLQGGASEFNVHSFSRDIIIYSAGQALLFIISAIQGLLIPKFLSVTDYGYFQAFLLYVNYIALLHLGFIDGAYVRWAKKAETLVKTELKPSFIYLIIQLFAVTLPLSILCIIFLQSQNQIIFISVLIYGFISDVFGLFFIAAQSEKKFKFITIVNIVKALFVFGLVIALLLSQNSQFYMIIMAFIGGQLVFGLAMLYLFRQYLGGKARLNNALGYARANLGIGIFVLPGNFIIILFMTLDRLAVNTSFSVEQFAVYSFALSVVIIVYLFISAIAQVLFPYLTRVKHELRTEVYRLGKPSLLLAWCAVLIIYYPFVWLINRFFPQYVECIPILAILLCSVAFGSVIQILHVNYYISYFKQKKYFYIALTAFIIFGLLLAAIVIFNKTLVGIAIVTLSSLLIWYLGNELYLNRILKFSYRSLLKDLIFIVAVSLIFLLISFLSVPLLLQFFLYLAATAVLVFIFLRREMKELLELAVTVFKAVRR
jgi:O-antigen/teichoic acid export membrane protein